MNALALRLSGARYPGLRLQIDLTDAEAVALAAIVREGANYLLGLDVAHEIRDAMCSAIADGLGKPGSEVGDE